VFWYREADARRHEGSFGLLSGHGRHDVTGSPVRAETDPRTQARGRRTMKGPLSGPYGFCAPRRVAGWIGFNPDTKMPGAASAPGAIPPVYFLLYLQFKGRKSHVSMSDGKIVTFSQYLSLPGFISLDIARK